MYNIVPNVDDETKGRGERLSAYGRGKQIY